MTTESRTLPEVLIVEPDEYRSQKHCLDLMHDGGFRVGAVVNSKRQAVTWLNRHVPACAIINARLPDGNSSDLIRLLLKKNADMMVLVASEVEDDNIVMQTIAAGANGYILFSDSKTSVSNCLRLMAAGGSPVSPVIARSVLRSLHCRTERAVRNPENSPLSRRELDVMQLIAKGISFSDISEILSISEHTVTTHIKKIYRKLNVHSRGEAVYEARQMKLID